MVLICISLIISGFISFHVPVGHLYVFFGKMSIHLLCPFFNQVVWFLLLLSFMSYLYILDINPLSEICFSNIVSHLVACLFILSMASFAVQEAFSFDVVLFIFAFVSLAWGDRSRRTLLRLMSKNVLPMFSSRSFMVSGLIFKSLIYIELIFVYSMRQGLVSFFCMWLSSFPSATSC